MRVLTAMSGRFLQNEGSIKMLESWQVCMSLLSLRCFVSAIGILEVVAKCLTCVHLVLLLWLFISIKLDGWMLLLTGNDMV